VIDQCAILEKPIVVANPLLLLLQLQTFVTLRSSPEAQELIML
jgi:hypothetical protein